MKAGLLGWPAGHSRSPALFAALGAETGVRVEYQKYAVTPPGLRRVLERMRREGFAGLNVTIPHKEAVRRFLSEEAPEAQAIGAVNALRAGPRGWVGHNTDAAGFMDCLREHRVRVRGTSAVLFGAGGAARAVAYALGKAGASRVTIINRHQRRAGRISREMGRRFPKTKYTAARRHPADAARSTARITINCTPLGMEGFPALSPLPLDWKPARGAWAVDLVYRPAATPFLVQAAAAGARTIGGIDMLVYQALRSWELWRGPLGAVRRSRLKRAVLRRIV